MGDELLSQEEINELLSDELSFEKLVSREREERLRECFASMTEGYAREFTALSDSDFSVCDEEPILLEVVQARRLVSHLSFPRLAGKAVLSNGVEERVLWLMDFDTASAVLSGVMEEGIALDSVVLEEGREVIRLLEQAFARMGGVTARELSGLTGTKTSCGGVEVESCSDGEGLLGLLPSQEILVVKAFFEVGGERLPFVTVLGTSLLVSLLEEDAEEDAGSRKGSVHARPVRFSELGKEPEEERAGRTRLGLVLDLSLSVSAELGRTQMPIREILRLGKGSIIELNKLAGEPVDVRVNGKIIARGEVVVIDENFGVRLTEITSPGERLGRT